MEDRRHVSLCMRLCTQSDWAKCHLARGCLQCPFHLSIWLHRSVRRQAPYILKHCLRWNLREITNDSSSRWLMRNDSGQASWERGTKLNLHPLAALTIMGLHPLLIQWRCNNLERYFMIELQVGHALKRLSVETVFEKEDPDEGEEERKRMRMLLQMAADELSHPAIDSLADLWSNFSAQPGCIKGCRQQSKKCTWFLHLMAT